jgi:radical SAM protein with 4Fe4S-binding SPASM domain
MLDVGFLYAGIETPSRVYRFKHIIEYLISPDPDSFPTPIPVSERKPVVVWNVTRACNLNCLHCYSDSDASRHPDELTTLEGKELIWDLALFRVPYLLLSGGEPLIREDIFELISYARSKNIDVGLSTNGTLITKAIAKRIREEGVSYVGISLDGIGEVNDRFRGRRGAFKEALHGFQNLIHLGQRTGLRLTLTRHTALDLAPVFELAEKEQIERVCFYHLVPVGRGSQDIALNHAETRKAIDDILAWTLRLKSMGISKEVLTVDNPCDRPYMYMKLLKSGDRRADLIQRLLKFEGGELYGSGVGIGCVDWAGNVHPDQFWMHYTVGNVRQRVFSKLWGEAPDPLLSKLRDRKRYLKGRCSNCRWLDMCGGGFRVRAELMTGDPWAPDPACYLTDEEIA